jgi:CRP-like cAMP-binding protein
LLCQLQLQLHSQVRSPYKMGDSFGELALMYNSRRAATVRAASDCKLWSISRMAVRCILTRRKQEVRLLSHMPLG